MLFFFAKASVGLSNSKLMSVFGYRANKSPSSTVYGMGHYMYVYVYMYYCLLFYCLTLLFYVYVCILFLYKIFFYYINLNIINVKYVSKTKNISLNNVTPFP